MIVIADSGSTKCDWIILDDQFNEIASTYTMGFNPYFHNEAVIAENIHDNDILKKYAETVDHIYFYGAGCSTKELCNTVKNGLNLVFKNSDISVDHDLLGAAYATYNGSPQICCILGTGSNSCYFDGQNLKEEIPSLGYILGDEGSGSYFGKKMLIDFLYHKMPAHIAQEFQSAYNLNIKSVVKRVYKEPNANVYLAGFTRFISDHKNDPYFRELLHNGMKHFLEVHVKCFVEYKEINVNFIGSIAYHFQASIYSAAKELGISIGEIVQKPIDNLVRYHKLYGNKKGS